MPRDFQPLSSSRTKILTHVPVVKVSTTFFVVHFFFQCLNLLCMGKLDNRQCCCSWCLHDLGGRVDADEFIVALVMLLSEVDMEHMFEVQFFRQSHAMWP